MPATRIDATYRVTTPMFCGGASGEKAELRLPSFKGVLRYWWRALAWSKYDGDLAKIAEKEDALFGSAGGGQSRVSMRLESLARAEIRQAGKVLQVPGTNQPVGDGARYLGYGVMEAFASQKKGTAAGQLTRGCLDGGFAFTVQMRLATDCGKGVGPDQLALLEHALMCVGVFGGLGAKSRKGYGSVAIRSLTVGKESRTIPTSMAKLGQTITDLHRGYASRNRRLPEYTAWSQDARYLLVKSRKQEPAQEPLALLDLLGRELVRFRSRGRNGRVLRNIPSELNFEPDHNLMKDVENGQRPPTHPERVAFGLPHNYGPKKPHQQVGPHDRDLNRRASPLFIHIHECDEGPVAVLSFLPARFLPDGTRINVGGHPIPQSPQDQLYEPIHRFLNRLLNKGEGLEGKCREPLVAEEVPS